MSLLNRSNVGYLSGLIIIYKLLLVEKCLTQDEILGRCKPNTIYEDQEGKPDSARPHLNNSLLTWMHLGVFVKLENGLSINPKIAKDDLKLEKLPSVARIAVLEASNNKNFFEDERIGCSDFTRILAWFLMQDVWDKDLTTSDEINKLFRQQFGDDSAFPTNSVIWDGFKAWSQFLGFAWSPHTSKAKVEPDPTIPIRDILPKLFKPGTTIEASDFIAKLAEAIPVLDGGEYRKQVEDRLGETSGEYSWRPLPDHQLSTSLSRALLRLREDGIIKFIRKDDSKQMLSLTGRNRRVIEESFSHFKFNKKNR